MKITSKIALSLLLLSGFANAESVPTDLQWQRMHEVIFNNIYWDSGTPAEKAEANTIWSPLIEQATAKGYSSFILLAKAETEDSYYQFSMISGPETECREPPNFDRTSGVLMLYQICPMQVIRQDKKSDHITPKIYPNFCYLNVGDNPKTESLQHTEFAIDKQENIAYFRTIMYGKKVEACNRSITLE